MPEHSRPKAQLFDIQLPMMIEGREHIDHCAGFFMQPPLSENEATQLAEQLNRIQDRNYPMEEIFPALRDRPQGQRGIDSRVRSGLRRLGERLREFPKYPFHVHQDPTAGPCVLLLSPSTGLLKTLTFWLQERGYDVFSAMSKSPHTHIPPHDWATIIEPAHCFSGEPIRNRSGRDGV